MLKSTCSDAGWRSEYLTSNSWLFKPLGDTVSFETGSVGCTWKDTHEQWLVSVTEWSECWKGESRHKSKQQQKQKTHNHRHKGKEYPERESYVVYRPRLQRFIHISARRLSSQEEILALCASSSPPEKYEPSHIQQYINTRSYFLTWACVTAETVSANLLMLTWLWPLTICCWKSLSM